MFTEREDHAHKEEGQAGMQGGGNGCGARSTNVSLHGRSGENLFTCLDSSCNSFLIEHYTQKWDEVKTVETSEIRSVILHGWTVINELGTDKHLIKPNGKTPGQKRVTLCVLKKPHSLKMNEYIFLF